MESKTIDKIIHVSKILIYSAIFYFFFALFEYQIVDQNWDINSFIVERLNAGKFIKLIVTNDPTVYSHLWYLLALIYCYVFCLFFFRNDKRISNVCILAVVLLICYSCLQEFGSVLGIKRSIHIIGTEYDIYLFNLFIFRALPFFLFGVLGRRFQNKISKIPMNTPSAILLVCFGGILAIVERKYFGETQFFIGNYIMIFAMIILAIKNPNFENKLISYIGRELSLYVYILHIAVGKVITIVARLNGWTGRKFYLYGRAFTVIVITLLIAMLIVEVKKLLKKIEFKS